MMRLAGFVTVLFLLSWSAFASDVTGTWQVALMVTAPDGSTQRDTGIAVLKQTGDSITGSMGPDQSRQNPISEGTIKDNKVILKISPQPDRTMTFDLTINGEKLVGTAERTGDPRKATVEFVKEGQK
jgi:hypothetical protein